MEKKEVDPAIAEAIDAPEMKPPAEGIPQPAEFMDALKGQGLDGHAVAYQRAVDIAKAVKEAGGRALLIGGFVRDLYFGKVSKDIDLEVYGLPLEKLREVVASQGEVKEVGRSFGVLKVGLGKEVGVDLDVSLPRRDSKKGKGHKGIQADVDPNMSIEEAARRRDFTMNSIAADPLTGEVFDYYGGLEDIKERRLRVTNARQFSEDPLRALRAMQFIGRFGVEMDEETKRVVLETIALPEFREQPAERIWDEWVKLLLKSDKPSRGLLVGHELGVYEAINPEIQQLIEPAADSSPEARGGCWLETLDIIDEVAKKVNREGLSKSEAMAVMLAAVCVRFPDQDTVQSFLKGVGADKAFRNNLVPNKVVKLLPALAEPAELYAQAKAEEKEIPDGDIRQLAETIHPATIRELVLLAEAEHRGKNRESEPDSPAEVLLPPDSFPPTNWLLPRARELGVETSEPAPLTQGRDWLGLGFKPGPEIGQLNKLANRLRDEKEMTREEVLAAASGAKSAKEAVGRLNKLLTA